MPDAYIYPEDRTHGDFCLPNIFGIADKWCDIAIGFRNFSHRHKRKYQGPTDWPYNDSLLFEALHIQPDWEKIHYYMVLDEFF